MSIEIKQISKNYNNFKAVKNLNFQIDAMDLQSDYLDPMDAKNHNYWNDILILIKPSKGKILINGKDIENENDRIKVLERMNFISLM